jgi:hypothetical protein
MKGRKSKLDPHADRIAEWYRAEPSLTLEDCCARLRALGCPVSTGRLSDYLAAQRAQALQDSLLAGIVSGSRMARQIDEAFAKNPPPELKTLVGLVKNLVLNLNVNGQADPALLDVANTMLKTVLEFARLEAKQADTALAERRLKLLEQQDTDTRQTLANPALSAADKEAKIKRIFGLA